MRSTGLSRAELEARLASRDVRCAYWRRGGGRGERDCAPLVVCVGDRERELRGDPKRGERPGNKRPPGEVERLGDGVRSPPCTCRQPLPNRHCPRL